MLSFPEMESIPSSYALAILKLKSLLLTMESSSTLSFYSTSPFSGIYVESEALIVVPL